MDHKKLLRSSSQMILNRDMPAGLSRSYSTANLSNWSGKRYNASWHAYSPSISHYSKVYPSPYISQRHKYSSDSWHRIFHQPSPRFYRPWRSSYISPQYLSGPSYYRRYYYPDRYCFNYYPFRSAIFGF
uniref:Uncharacterized protein n=1 Tax=Panagrolaimus sp. PS1159 TaxID=55785 RepID=A0AC35G1A1_9BILA